MTDVTLTLPDLGDKREWSLKALTMRATPGGGVQFEVGGSAEALSPEGARLTAAHLLALADLAEKPAARDGDATEELSWFIREVRSEHQADPAPGPSTFDRDLAERLVNSGYAGGGSRG